MSSASKGLLYRLRGLCWGRRGWRQSVCGEKSGEIVLRLEFALTSPRTGVHRQVRQPFTYNYSVPIEAVGHCVGGHTGTTTC